jgi:general secretion pathway protein G
MVERFAPRVRGFTIIELLVVMALIALLLTIATPRYLQSVDRAKESTLRESLFVMRDAIDKFRADRGSYPTSLNELVEHRYLRVVPIDPMTNRIDTWMFVLAQEPNRGVADVRSGATGTASDGKPFREW